MFALADNGKKWDRVEIYSDSQAAVKALASTTIRSSVVLECATALNEVAKRSRITLRWIKAHIGHKGNERADFLTKEGAK